MKRYFFCLKIMLLLLAAQNMNAAELLERESDNLIRLRDVENSLQKTSAATTKATAQPIAKRAHEIVQQANQEATNDINDLRNYVAEFIKQNKDNQKLVEASLVHLEIEEALYPLMSLQKRLSRLQDSSDKDKKVAKRIANALLSKNIPLDEKINGLEVREKLALESLRQAAELQPVRAVYAPGAVKTGEEEPLIPTMEEEPSDIQAAETSAIKPPEQSSASLVNQLQFPASVVPLEKARTFKATTAEQFQALQNANQQLLALQKRLTDVQKFRTLPKGSADAVNMTRANPYLVGDLLDVQGLQSQINAMQQSIEALKKDTITKGQEHRPIWQFLQDVMEKDAAASEMSPQQLKKVLAIMGGLLAIPIIAVVIVGILEGTGTISFAPKKSVPIVSEVSITKSASFNFYIQLNSAPAESWEILPTSSHLLRPIKSGTGRDPSNPNNSFTFITVQTFGQKGVAAIAFVRINNQSKQRLEIRRYTITLVQ